VAKTSQRQTAAPTRVGIISLGCAKNLVDAEVMLGSLMADGLEITNDPAEADALIVNTCSFIDSAQEESVDTILESAELRAAQRPGQALIVSGCLPQRFRKELPKLMPEVDAFMGVDQVASVSRIVREAIAHRQTQPSNGAPKKAKPAPPLSEITARPQYVPDVETPRFRLTPRHFAYVKIAEGCNHPCSFCIIPRMRGSHRSRAQSDIVDEARRLIAQGVRELNLISQDSTYYGMDLRPGQRRGISSPENFARANADLPADAASLSTLLRELNDLRGDFWIRLLYTHPAHWTDELIKTIADCPKVARYVDIPLQHIHDVMLERMRRETDGAYIRDLLARIREGIPGIALRTTFIVGFPGETDKRFEVLLDFIRETKFERLGVFAYSKEDGTRAGGMRGQVSDAVKKQRCAAAMAVQREVSRAHGQAQHGRKLYVLAEKLADKQDLKGAKVHSWEHGLIRETTRKSARLKGSQYTLARGEADAPDIDGRVYVQGELPLGDFCWVRVIGHTDYDLIADRM
jgi:ribosomal protein S12 methylthiotransferase